MNKIVQKYKNNNHNNEENINYQDDSKITIPRFCNNYDNNNDLNLENNNDSNNDLTFENNNDEIVLYDNASVLDRIKSKCYEIPGFKGKKKYFFFK